MKKIEVVDFIPTHGEDIYSRILQRAYFIPTEPEFKKVCPPAGYARTVLLDGKVVACAGVARLWEGVGEAWAIFDEEFLQRKLTLVKLVRDGCAKAQESLHLHRVHFHVIHGYHAGYRLAMALGFVYEGVCFAWGADKKSYTRWSKLYM